MSDSTLNKILVPIGFSEQSVLAMDHAVHLAKRMDAEIVVLSVLEDSGVWARLFASEIEQQNERLKKEVTAKLEDLITQHKGSGVKMSHMIAKGTVYDEIARVAEMLDIDLVVMGTNGKPHNFRKSMIGSNAYRVVNLVKAPVITIRGVAEPRDYKRIIFPLMIDAQSREKVGHALHYARMFESEIRVIGIASKGNDREVKQIRAQIKQVEKFINDAGVNCSSEMLDGRNAAQVTLDYTSNSAGDLIIIMDEGESGLGLRLISNDVERIIYSADVPVLSITPSRVKYASQFSNF